MRTVAMNSGRLCLDIDDDLKNIDVHDTVLNSSVAVSTNSANSNNSDLDDLSVPPFIDFCIVSANVSVRVHPTSVD